MKFSSTSWKVCRGIYVPCFKLTPTLSAAPYFINKIRINTVVNKHTVDYQPSPSGLTSRIHPLIFRWRPQGSISPDNSWIFSQTCIFHHGENFSYGENFQIYGVKITGKCICQSKKLIFLFIFSCPWANSLQILIITPTGRKILHISPRQLFFWKSWYKKGRARNLWAEKIIKINLCWYWSQVLINPTFFVFVLLCHNLDSGMLKCKDFNTTKKNPLKKCTGITVWKMKCCPTRFFNRFTHRVKLNSLSLHFLSILKSFIPLPY